LRKNKKTTGIERNI